VDGLRVDSCFLDFVMRLYDWNFLTQLVILNVIFSTYMRYLLLNDKIIKVFKNN